MTSKLWEKMKVRKSTRSEECHNFHKGSRWLCRKYDVWVKAGRGGKGWQEELFGTLETEVQRVSLGCWILSRRVEHWGQGRWSCLPSETCGTQGAALRCHLHSHHAELGVLEAGERREQKVIG